MPDLTSKLEHEALFSDEDPLRVTIEGVGSFRFADEVVNPPLEDDINPERTPLIYIVEALGLMVWETPEDREAGKTPNGDTLRKALADALRDNVVSLGQLGDLLTDVMEAYGDALRRSTARAGGRPTRRPRR